MLCPNREARAFVITLAMSVKTPVDSTTACRRRESKNG